MGKIGYKCKDDLIWWLDLMRSGILPQGCVSHSDSIAELGWVVSEMSIKSSEGWNLMCWLMMLHNQSWCSISFVPHYSFHLAFPYTYLSLSSPLYLASPFPVTIIASFRTIKWVQKDVPQWMWGPDKMTGQTVSHVGQTGQAMGILRWTQTRCCQWQT